MITNKIHLKIQKIHIVWMICLPSLRLRFAADCYKDRKKSKRSKTDSKEAQPHSDQEEHDCYKDQNAHKEYNSWTSSSLHYASSHVNRHF